MEAIEKKDKQEETRAATVEKMWKEKERWRAKKGETGGGEGKKGEKEENS